MPLFAPDSSLDRETVRDALERVYADGNYDLAPDDDGGGAAEILGPLGEALWTPLSQWWELLNGRLPWLDELLAAIVIVAALGVLIPRLLRRRRIDATPAGSASAGVTRADELRERAQSAREAGDCVAGARLLLHAAIVRLEEAERQVNPPGATNQELQRRYVGEGVARPLATLVDRVDRSWFGGRPCTDDDFQECLDAHDAVAAVTGPARVLSR